MIKVLEHWICEIIQTVTISPCRRGIDTQSETCQRFFREGLTISFTKIMTDEAVSSWRSESVQFSCGIDKRDTSSITYCFLQVRYTQVHSKELRAYGRVGKCCRHMMLLDSIE